MIPYGCRPRPRGAEAQRHRGSGLKAQAKGSASYMSADEESIALVVGAWLARQFPQLGSTLDWDKYH